jgi:hypothetical protein
MNKKSLLALSFCTVTLFSCNTYHLSKQSLMEQFADSRTEKKYLFFIMPPFVFFPGIVNGNNLRTITCLDKKGTEVTLNVTNHTGVRITKNDGKKTTFYFNTLCLQDSLISGSKTHFFNAPIKKIKLSDIEKIELQR